MRMKVVAVANQKGGVGKTTTAVVVASLLAERLRVVLIDLDAQGSATKWLLGFQTEIEPSASMASVLIPEGRAKKGASIASILQESGIAQLRIAPSGPEMAALEPHLMTTIIDREYRLRFALEELGQEESCDVVIIDCPPSLGAITLNALTAADLVLIPVEPNALAAAGLSDILETIGALQRRTNPELKIFGVLPVRVRKTRLAQTTLSALERGLEGVGRLLPFISEAVVVQEAAQSGQALGRFAPDNVATLAYRAVAGELASEVA